MTSSIRTLIVIQMKVRVIGINFVSHIFKSTTHNKTAMDVCKESLFKPVITSILLHYDFNVLIKMPLSPCCNVVSSLSVIQAVKQLVHVLLTSCMMCLLSIPECNSLNSLVSETFIRFFLETIGHYSLFMTQGERGERVFQREAFRKSVASKSIRRFLGVFMESQMFTGFIQDRELRKCRAKGRTTEAHLFS